MFRNGIMQLMNHTLEQLPEGESEEEHSYRSGGASPMARTKHPHHHNQEQGKVVDRRSSQVEEIVSVFIEVIEHSFQKSLLEEEEEKPLDMTWPEDNVKRFTYVCLAPVLIPMWVTIPDVRKEVCHRQF